MWVQGGRHPPNKKLQHWIKFWSSFTRPQDVQHSSKRVRKGSQDGPRWPKVAPRECKVVPTTLQDTPKMVQAGPKWLHDGPRCPE